MMGKKSIALILLSLTQMVSAETFTGKLSGTQDNILLTSYNNGEVSEQSKVIMPSDFLYTMDDVVLSRPSYYYQFKGERISDKEIEVVQTPTIVAGKAKLTGKLTFDGENYFLAGAAVRFGRTKSIYNNQFDNLSKASFVDKNVQAIGNWEDDRGQKIFTINALTFNNLFSAQEKNLYPAPKKFQRSPLRYIINTMPSDSASQSSQAFRGTVMKTDSSVVKPGTHALIITLSGRQGDAANTVGGHFAIGMGQVDSNFNIQGEVFNFYFEGPKEVPAGNTEITSYFGHLIQGQNNYRPTYTVLVYGKSQEELKKVRDALEADLHRVRVEKGLGITPMYNCSTSAFAALKPIGITGQHEHRLSLKRLIAPRKAPGLDAGQGKQLSYALRSDYATFIPRQTFESLVTGIKKRGEKMGIHRMDYVFLPQYVSKRPVGGMSAKNMLQTLSFYGLDMLRARQIKKYEEAKQTLEDPKASKRAKRKAQKRVDKFKNDKEFQSTLEVFRKVFFKQKGAERAVKTARLI